MPFSKVLTGLTFSYCVLVPRRARGGLSPSGTPSISLAQHSAWFEFVMSLSKHEAVSYPVHQSRSAPPLVGLRRSKQQYLLQCHLAPLEALGAAPREALVGERRLRCTLLPEAIGVVMVDAALAERACAQLALGRLACQALGRRRQRARHERVGLKELERLRGQQGAQSMLTSTSRFR